MSMFVTPSFQRAPIFNSNLIIWHGYFDNTKQAENTFESKIKHIEEIEKKKLKTKKMQLINRKCHGLFLFKFTIELE